MLQRSRRDGTKAVHEKYVESRFPRYFAFESFGENVDIAHMDETVATVASDEDANRLIKDRDEMIDAMFLLANALESVDQELLKEVWYNKIARR